MNDGPMMEFPELRSGTTALESTSELTTEQQAAAEHVLNRPAIVDAGAGTGKTHTIINRVAYLARSGICAADKILLLTFARKAAAELRRRVLERLGPDVEPPHCSTFHAFAANVLADHAYELQVSPDATVIEDIDARLEFRSAFDEVIHSDHEDADALPLRPAQRDQLRDGLFAIAQRLKEQAIKVDDFERRALAAADAIERIPFREIRPEGKTKKPRNPVAQTTDARLRVEAEDARARARAAAKIFRRYEERLHRRHALTYADLLLLARDGIERNPSLASRLRGRYRHCIVDEFQDTDEAQWRFLATLFGAELENVTAVGDPRQSIYGFRGATPGNVTKFAGLPNAVRYALSENRRSRQEILDFAHAVIGEVSEDDAPLRAQRGAAGAQIVHVSSAWTFEDGAKRNADANRVAQADAVARLIRARLARGGIAPRDVAILSRNKTQLQPFTAALNAAGIPYRLLGGAGFYETSEIRDALAWLRLLADPLDGQAAARVCASAACGLTDAATAELAAGLPRDETGFARRLFVEPIPETLDADSRARIERVRSTIDALEPYAAAPLSASMPVVIGVTGLAHERAGGEQASANLRKLLRLATDFVTRNREAQAIDFVHYVDELARIEFDDREADAPADDAVTIMTAHAAKGLEWPVVFIIDVWPTNFPTSLVTLDEATGALLCREGRDDTPLFHIEVARRHPDARGMIPHEDDKESGPSDEERRLFYVALTRAKDELYILGGRSYRGKNPSGRTHVFVEEAERWLATQGWEVDEPIDDATPAIPRSADLALETPQTPTPSADARSSELDRSIADPRQTQVGALQLSFSSLHAFERCPRSLTYAMVMRLPDLRVGRKADSDETGDGEARRDASAPGALMADDYGRIVHRALERWSGARMHGDGVQTPETYVAQAISDLRLRLKAAEVKRASADVQAAMTALAAWRVEHAEAPFSMQYDDVVVKGYIDLIARDPHGSAVVLDYKTGTTAAREYALQLGIYREAARRVYDVADAACIIGRFADGGFSLETVDVPDVALVRGRIAAVATGLRDRDLTPRPGDWCYTCQYRAAPCDAYPAAKDRGS